MTEERIKEIVHKYIMDCFESDNADGLHELDDWGDFDDDETRKALNAGYYWFRWANVTVTFDD